MIRLINDGKNMEGTHTYRVQAGKQHICRFEHDRKDGLADCLQKAADAVELSEWADFIVRDDAKGG